ncbi:sulfatase family protein [Aporhodopirellula aestuarii]|uniref:Sulfatase n=1 Tax=Aporhodopirellula aestuarii TaxID=2950107 RepID=A0ABT0U316_9BACT|nr:sulfatase [Aporhodopirellula aestuarii]MCM2371262.1 sulfatase [Aporhodopirellula aestuarii]
MTLKRTILKIFTGLILLAGALTAGATAAAEKPNVVIILTDDQGYQDVGCYGAPKIKTPNLDRMADEGMRFTDFYVASSVCSASRAALLTGCYPQRVGIGGALFPNWKNEGLDPKHVTIAEMLKEAGYATAAVGKWHLGDAPEFLPINQGFDSYYGIPYSNDMFPAKAMAYAEDCLYREGVTPESLASAFPQEKEGLSRWERQPHKLKNKVPLMRNVQCIEFPADQNTLTRRYTEEAVRFIEQSVDIPFFLYLGHSMPHIPLYASPEFEGKSDAGLYGDCIEEIDWSVGEILDTLKRLGLDRNTLVFYSSDNGPWELKGSDDAKVKGNQNRRVGGSAGPLRGYKFSSWEGGMRVPTLMWSPGRIPSGQVCNEVASTIDMLPTLATLTGSELPASRIDGKSLVPLLEGRADAVSPHEAFFYGTQGVRAGDWKLIRNEKAFELYNLAEDISESRNVAGEHPEVMARLKKLLEEHKQDL